MSRKTVAKSLASTCDFRRKPENQLRFSWTVNVSVFIEQRNISFQNDISLKTMRLGVFLWEKLKIHHTYCRNCELGPAWEVKEQLLISLSCLSPGWVEKIQKFINFCLKVCHSGNLKHIKSTWRQLSSCERHKIVTKALGTMHAQHFFIAEQERLIYDSCCFWYWAFLCKPTDYESVFTSATHLLITGPTKTRSLRYA